MERGTALMHPGNVREQRFASQKWKENFAKTKKHRFVATTNTLDCHLKTTQRRGRKKIGFYVKRFSVLRVFFFLFLFLLPFPFIFLIITFWRIGRLEKRMRAQTHTSCNSTARIVLCSFSSYFIVGMSSVFETTSFPISSFSSYVVYIHSLSLSKKKKKSLIQSESINEEQETWLNKRERLNSIVS